MRVITVQFDYGSKDSYKRLLDVFRYSVVKNMPTVDLEVITCDPPRNIKDRSSGLVSNTAKLAIWIDRFLACEDDVIFMDCDMVVLKDMTDAFELDFDIAYTVRNGGLGKRQRIPINGGVLFAKYNERTINFLNEWLTINNRMFMNPAFHRDWRKKYAGMNQSAFGYMLERTNYCKAVSLPCSIYNVCNTEWADITENSRCLHIKSHLRRACLGTHKVSISKYMQYPYDLWKQYEDEYFTVKRLYDEEKRSKEKMGRNSRTPAKRQTRPRRGNWGVDGKNQRRSAEVTP